MDINKNPENTVAATLTLWGKRFTAVLALSLLLSAAPRLLMVFFDASGLFSRLNIDANWILERLGSTGASVREALAAVGITPQLSVPYISLAAGPLTALFITPVFNGTLALLTLSSFFDRKQGAASLISAALPMFLRLVWASVCAALFSLAAAIASAAAALLVSLIFGNLLSLWLFDFLAAVITLAVAAAASLASLEVGWITPAVVMGDNMGGFRAVRRSIELIRLRFWKNGLAMLGCTLFASAISSYAISIAAVFGSELAADILAALTGGLFTALVPICGARCYLASRNRAGEFGAPAPALDIPKE